MTDAQFEKVSYTDKPLYGPRKLLFCGFSQKVQPNFNKLLKFIGLSEIPKVWVAQDRADTGVGELIHLEDGAGWGVSSELARAIIIAGITQNEMHRHNKRLSEIKDETDALGHPDPDLRNLDNSKLVK